MPIIRPTGSSSRKKLSGSGACTAMAKAAAISGIAASRTGRNPRRSISGVAKVSATSVPTGVPISPSPSAPSRTPIACWMSGRRGKMLPRQNE